MLEHLYGDDLKGIKVYVMSPTHRDFHPYVVDSLLDTQKACIERGIDVAFDVKTIDWWLSIARSQCVDVFYKSDREYLFWVDSDIQFKTEDFLDVLWLTTKLGCVTTAYASRNDPMCGVPMVTEGMSVNINKYGCLSWWKLATGLGFCCVNRKIIGDILDKTDLMQTVYTEHGERLRGDTPHKIKLCIDFEYERGYGLRGEDHVFFYRVQEAGHIAWLWPHPTIEHLGRASWAARTYDLMPPNIKETVDQAIEALK